MSIGSMLAYAGHQIHNQRVTESFILYTVNFCAFMLDRKYRPHTCVVTGAKSAQDLVHVTTFLTISPITPLYTNDIKKMQRVGCLVSHCNYNS